MTCFPLPNLKEDLHEKKRRDKQAEEKAEKKPEGDYGKYFIPVDRTDWLCIPHGTLVGELPCTVLLYEADLYRICGSCHGRHLSDRVSALPLRNE